MTDTTWEVWKFPLDAANGGQCAIPVGGTFLGLGVQDADPVMWWKVNPKQPKTILRTFTIVGTGKPGFVGRLHYVASFQLFGANPMFPRFVGHVFTDEEFTREH